MASDNKYSISEQEFKDAIKLAGGGVVGDPGTQPQAQTPVEPYDPQSTPGMEVSPNLGQHIVDTAVDTVIGPTPQAEAFADPSKPEVPLQDTGMLDPTNLVAQAPGVAKALAPGAKALLADEVGALKLPGSLPMDEASRAARAVEQGFDPNKVYYHGTNTPGGIEAFDLNHAPKGSVGVAPRGAVFVTEDPKVAGNFAVNLKTKPASVHPVNVAVKDTFDYENPQHFRDLATRMRESLPADSGEKGIKELNSELDLIKKGEWSAIERPEVIKILKELGHDSFHVKEYGKKNLGIFDTSKIRSKFAEFDPAKAHLPNLSYAQGGSVMHLADGGEVAAPVQNNAQNTSMTGDNGQNINYQALMPQAEASPQESSLTPVVNPEGQLVNLPNHQVLDALGEGYQIAEPERIAEHKRQLQYGSGVEQLKTGLEGAASAATFGLSTGLETALGVNPEDIQARREVNPGSHMLGQMAGLAGSALIPGVGAANLMEHAGAAVAAPLLANGTTIAKIGSTAAKFAAENAIFQAGDEVSKMFAKDPGQTVETALIDTGLAGIFGGALGGGIGAVNPLWKATFGAKTGGVLKAMADRLGGGDGVTSEAMNNAIEASGLSVPAEVRTALSHDPALRQIFKTLEQSDVSSSGQELQATAAKFRRGVEEHLVGALGRTPKEAEALSQELSKAAVGQKLGKTLAGEYDALKSPLVDQFEKYKDMAKDVPLEQDVLAREPKYIPKPAQTIGGGDAGLMGQGIDVPTYAVEAGKQYVAKPGTASKIIDELSQLADKEGWTASADSDIMKEVNRAKKDIKGIKDLKGLTKYITTIGENTASKLPFGAQDPVSRAGMLMKNVLKEYEAETVMSHLQNTGVSKRAIDELQGARQAYKQLAELKNAVDYRLGAKGSTSGYGKAVRTMAGMDGESVLRRLSGAGDADLLQLLQKNFPQTSEILKNYHVDNLIANAANKAKGEGLISSSALRAGMDKMSPELRSFAISPEAQAKISAIGQVVDHLDSVPHNHSNTARTIQKLFSHLPGTAIGMASALGGHNVIGSGILGGIAHAVGKDAPDAMRLSLLKFLGSDKPISSEGFKSMLDFAQATIKGENLLSKSVKNVMKTGTQVLPSHMVPTNKDTAKLDRHLQEMQSKPEKLMDVGGNTGHYLPEHQQSIAETAVQATQYLNSLRPASSKANPLDPALPPTAQQKAVFNKALAIAQQPLMVLEHAQKGTLTQQDVITFKTLYPNLYQSISNKMHEQVLEAVDKGQIIPYKTRMGLSTLLGQPLDSTMTGQSILAAQPQQDPQQPGEQGPKAPAASQTKSLSKMPGMYATPGQQRNQRMQRD